MSITIPKQLIIYTKYSLPNQKHVDYYCFYTAPSKGTVVFSYRRQKVELRGYTVRFFEKTVKEAFKNETKYQVLGDLSICTSVGIMVFEMGMK